MLISFRSNCGPKNESKNLAEILNRYLNDVTPRKRSADSERIVLVGLMIEDWIKIPISQLQSIDITAYRNRRLVTVKPATFKSQFKILKHACAINEEEWDWVSPLLQLRRITR